MILAYALALLCVCSCCVKLWDAVDDARWRRAYLAKQVSAKRIQQAEAEPQTDQRSVLVDGTTVPSLPLPPSVPQPAWLVSHDEVLPLLSSSLASVEWDGLKAVPVLSPLSTERSEVPVEGSLQGFLLEGRSG